MAQKKKKTDAAPKAPKAPKKEQIATDKVEKLDRIDSLMFGKLDAEIRNALQGIKLAEYEILETRQKAAERLTQLEAHKKRLRADVERLKPEYAQLLDGIAQKYDIGDPSNIVIDPDTGIVRDARSLVNAEG